MRPSGVGIIFALLASMIIGCGDSGREVGPPSDAGKSQITDEFKASMERSGNKMMKKPSLRKDSGAPAKQGG
jgi:hypothetical protein